MGGNQLLNLMSCGWETLPIRSLLTTGTSVSASEPVAEWCNPRGGDSHGSLLCCIAAIASGNLNGKSQQ